MNAAGWRPRSGRHRNRFTRLQFAGFAPKREIPVRWGRTSTRFTYEVQ